MASPRFFYLIALMLAVFYSPTAKSDCSDPISTAVTVSVPVGSNNVQRAPIVSGTIVDQLEANYPAASRCGTVVYDVRVTLKVGFYLVPLLPLVGEIKDDEAWKDLVPSLISERLGVDGVTGSNYSTSGCGDNCQNVGISGLDQNGTWVNLTITYLATFSCSGSNCTLTLTLLDTAMTHAADGSPYFGPGILTSNEEASEVFGET